MVEYMNVASETLNELSKKVSKIMLDGWIPIGEPEHVLIHRINIYKYTQRLVRNKYAKS